MRKENQQEAGEGLEQKQTNEMVPPATKSLKHTCDHTLVTHTRSRTPYARTHRHTAPHTHTTCLGVWGTI